GGPLQEAGVLRRRADDPHDRGEDDVGADRPPVRGVPRRGAAGRGGDDAGLRGPRGPAAGAARVAAAAAEGADEQITPGPAPGASAGCPEEVAPMPRLRSFTAALLAAALAVPLLAGCPGATTGKAGKDGAADKGKTGGDAQPKTDAEKIKPPTPDPGQ